LKVGLTEIQETSQDVMMVSQNTQLVDKRKGLFSHS